MITQKDTFVASSSRKLAVRLRPDLSIRRQRHRGKVYFVVKDPLGLKYFRFPEEECFLLRLLDGTCSLDDLRRRFEEEFAPRRIDAKDLHGFIGKLHECGLLIANAEGQGRQLRRQRDKRRKRERIVQLTNILCMRWRGVDPDQFLKRLSPWTNWLFTRWTLAVVAIVAMSALLLVMTHYAQFVARMPDLHEFFGPRNAIYLTLAIAITKVLHELGHGLCCKRFGGECHEIGVMLLVLTPCLYCNVSDSWLLPNRWHRAAIGAAGMYVELIIASAATFVWWYSEPGLLNYLCLAVMFVCSVSTLLFNGNPLMRLDGYYILADLVEIPNLRQKSAELLRRWLARGCLGISRPESGVGSMTCRLALGLYATSAAIYRVIVVVSIALFLCKLLAPYQLQVIGQLFALLSVSGLFCGALLPAFDAVRAPGFLLRIKLRRAMGTVIAMLMLLSVIIFVPLPYAVQCPTEVQAGGTCGVFARIHGQILRCVVKPGAYVNQNDLIAELTNDQLHQRVLDLEHTVRRRRSEINTLQYQLNLRRHVGVAAQLPELIAQLDAAENQLDQMLAEEGRLRIVAPKSGVILPGFIKSAAVADEYPLAGWTGSLLDESNLGACLEPQDELCRIGDAHDFEAVLAVDQATFDFVQPGQAVRIQLDSYADRLFPAKVSSKSDISRQPLNECRPSMQLQTGGLLSTRMSRAGKQQPLSTTYQVTVALTGDESVFQAGQRGRAKIQVAPRTLGNRLRRYIASTFHFDIGI